MLEPHDRSLLFDILKPPEDHTLDVAIATTYTLDLLALLTAPVAFSLFDVDDHRDLLNQDSLTLLESLRRYADKLTIFCHAGYIGLPKAQFPQFEFLEKCVVQCQPPHDPAAAFHSKLWVLRFVAPESRVTYRLACLTRNLTFDRCWDTALTLEGPVTGRNVALNHPLGDFLRELPKMAPSADDAVRQRVTTVESEVRRVQFELPEGFESYAFHSFGTTSATPFPFEDRPGRMFIVSPFVSEGGLKRLTTNRQETRLVSRAETFGQPDCDFSSVNRCYVLARGAEDEPEDNAGAPHERVDLTRGLHAKCYVIEHGARAHIFTGSANATQAAFGRNVEFLVELVGPKSRFGIDVLFKREEGKTSLGDLLEEFTPKPVPIDAEEEGFRAAVERTRLLMVAARFSATVAEVVGGFALELTLDAPLPPLPADVVVSCWPVTLGRARSKELASSATKVTFENLSLEALSSFIAFEVALRGTDRKEVFVLNIALQGVPQDRRERLLRAFIKDRGRLMRFLMFLLADDAELADAMGAKDVMRGNGNGQDAVYSNGALLESLLRTLHRAPERLDAVARLVDDVRRDPEGRELLPPAFDKVWEPIWTARRGAQQ